ncbi:hypothetical protein Pelo_2458 [Pelomyxa schiedti]|nr:hypothetical protein Pelo_2458 [Pelomyxa schiedti]
MFLRFAQLGADECQYLFSRNVIVQFVDFYMGDESPYSPKSEKRPSMGDKATPPNISHVLDLMEYLLKQMREISTYSVSDLDKEALRYNEFYEKAMRENQNPEAIASIVTILGENQTFSKGIILAVKRGLDELKAERFPPFYTALTALLKINDGDQLTRTSRAYKALCYVIDRNIKYPTETASVLTFLGNKELPHLRAQVWEHFVDLGNPGYLVGNKVSVCEATCSLLQSFVSESLPDSELDSLVEHLVSFFKDEKNFEYGKDSHPRQFVPFLTLLQLSLRGDSQKKIFLEHIDEFYPILISIVTVNMECDESKRSMLDLWHSLLHSCGEILSDFLSKPQHWRALFDVWICFRNDKFLNEYNKIATPSVYRCMLLCSQSNDQFLTDLGNNPNFSWAVDHFLLENWPLFTESQKAIHTILSYGCSHKDVGPVYRCLIRNRIAALKSVVEGTAHHVIQLLDYATLSTEDTYELLKAPKLMRFLFQALGSILGNSKYREQYASTGLTLATNALSLVLENPSSLTATQQEQLVVELGHVMEFFVIKWVEWAAIPLASDMKLSSCFTETLFKWQNLKFLAVAVPQLKKQTQSLLPKRESTPLTYTIAVLAAQYGVSSTREASNPNLITDSIELALNVVMLCPTDTQCSTLLLSAYEHDSTSPLVLSCLSRRPDFLVDCLVHPSFQLKPPLLPFLERIFPQVCASLDLPHLSIILDTLAFQVREVVSTATTVYPSLPKLLAALLVVLQHPQTRDLLLKQVDTAVLLSLTTEETAVRLNLQFNDYRNLGTKLAQVLQL